MMPLKVDVQLCATRLDDDRDLQTPTTREVVAASLTAHAQSEGVSRVSFVDEQYPLQTSASSLSHRVRVTHDEEKAADMAAEKAFVPPVQLDLASLNQVPRRAEGQELVLSQRSSTGYHGVYALAANSDQAVLRFGAHAGRIGTYGYTPCELPEGNDERVQGRAKRGRNDADYYHLGYFPTAVQAAAAYARHVRNQRRVAGPPSAAPTCTSPSLPAPRVIERVIKSGIGPDGESYFLVFWQGLPSTLTFERESTLFRWSTGHKQFKYEHPLAERSLSTSCPPPIEPPIAYHPSTEPSRLHETTPTTTQSTSQSMDTERSVDKNPESDGTAEQINAAGTLMRMIRHQGEASAAQRLEHQQSEGEPFAARKQVEEEAEEAEGSADTEEKSSEGTKDLDDDLCMELEPEYLDDNHDEPGHLMQLDEPGPEDSFSAPAASVLVFHLSDLKGAKLADMQ